MIAAFTLLVTCMISGLVLPVAAEDSTVAVGQIIYNATFDGLVQDADSNWNYTHVFDANGGTTVPVHVDTEENSYIQIPVGAYNSNAGVLHSPVVYHNVQIGDWYRISFRVRKTQADKTWVYMQPLGVVTSNPEFSWQIANDSASSSKGVGEWFTYNCYIKADRTSTLMYLKFYTRKYWDSSYGTQYPLDIDDIQIEALPAGTDLSDLNLLYGGDFNKGAIGSLNDNSMTGLFSDGGEVVAEPGNAANKVLHMTGNGQAAFYTDWVYDGGMTFMQPDSIYKLTYRQKGTGTTNPGMLPAYGVGTQLSVAGDPGTASPDEWKTITVYYETHATVGSALHNSAFNFLTSGDVYLDDFVLQEVPVATSFELADTALTMTTGQTSTLEVVTTPEDAYVSLTWSSNAESVATVENGVVTAVGPGEATITVTDGTITDTVTVTVNAATAPATGITLDKTQITLLAGATDTLTVTAVPQGGLYATPLKWTTTDAGVATVEDGVVTAMGIGTATITVSTADDALSASCTVTVAETVIYERDFEATVDWHLSTYNGSMLSAVEDQTSGNHYIQFTTQKAHSEFNNGVAVATNEWYRLSFKVRNTAAAKASFTVYVNNIFSGGNASYAQLTFEAPADGEWTLYNVYFQPNRDQPKLYLTFEAKTSVTLDLDDVQVARVRESGDLYGHNLLYGGDFENGKVASLDGANFDGLFADGGNVINDAGNNVLHLTAESTDTFFHNDMAATVIKYPGYHLKTNAIYKLTYRQKGEGTTKLSANATYGTLLAVQGEPEKASGAWKTVTAYYRYTGETTHGVNYLLGFQTLGDVYLDDFVLQEVPVATSFELADTVLTMTAGETSTLEVVMTPAGAYAPLTWSSDAESVATVENGVVTAVGPGEATITATDGTTTKTVTVTVSAVQATDLMLSKQAVTLLAGETETLTVTALPIGGSHQPLVWTTSDASVATVTDGVITAVSAGTATIAVTAGGLSASCVVTVPNNVVTGGDFEASDTDGIGTFANVKSSNTGYWYIAPGEGFGGGNALAINYKVGGDDRLLKWPTFKPNTTYALYFVAKGPAVRVQLLYF